MPSGSKQGLEYGKHVGRTTDTELVDRLYEAYPAWKVQYGLDKPEFRSHQFSTEMRRVGLAAGARIVEVGFGGGVFLDWARLAGYETYGVERNEAFCQSASERGHQVALGTLRDLEDGIRGKADLVVCFDVLEHLSIGEIADLFADARAILRTGGRLMARFPNGASPFGRVSQHGDLTHKTTLSADSVEQLGALAGYSLVSAHNAARPMRTGGRSRYWDNVVVRKCVYGIRDMVNALVGGIYFGRLLPLDPNVTVVLEKNGDCHSLSA